MASRLASGMTSDIADLQAHLQSLSPLDLLEVLAAASNSPDRPVEWVPPLVQVHLRSSSVLRGHLVGVGVGKSGEDRHFTIRIEPKSSTHHGCDLAYINGADLEAVVLFDVDDLLPFLPTR